MSPEHLTTKSKPDNWCGTKITTDANEADQVSIDDNMPAFPEGQRYYPCITQDGVMPTFGVPPDASSGSRGDGFDSIMVGTKELIPRWVASTNLLYFVVKNGFSDDDFKYVFLRSHARCSRKKCYYGLSKNGRLVLKDAFHGI